MRDDFSKNTLEILAKRVGIRCSNPGCRKLTTGPRCEATQIINIGVGAHITAAASGGPRFNPDLSSDERKSPINGIWLCQNCAKLVDNDTNRYPVKILQIWKDLAESAALSELEGCAISQKQSQENQIDLDISYLKVKMESERHDYILKVSVQNLGTDIIHQYHLDLEFPDCVIEQPKTITSFVENRSNRGSCFFRAIFQSQVDAIYPGDSKEVISFPYYMNHGIYFNRGKLFEQIVKATFYRVDFQPLTLEKSFKDLQFF